MTETIINFAYMQRTIFIENHILEDWFDLLRTGV